MMAIEVRCIDCKTTWAIGPALSASGSWRPFCPLDGGRLMCTGKILHDHAALKAGGMVLRPLPPARFRA